MVIRNRFGKVLGTALGLVLLVEMLVSPLPVIALSQPVVTLDNPQPGQESGYSIVFTTGKQLLSGDLIVISFPDGTVLNHPIFNITITASSGWIDGSYLPAVVTGVYFDSNSGSRIITGRLGSTNQIGESSQVNISIQSGITNPSQEGAYTLTIQTSQETSPVLSQPYSIPPATPEPPSPAAVPQPDVILNNPQPGQESSYSVWFTINSQLTDTDNITITFPEGTVLNNPAAAVSASRGWVDTSYLPSILDGVVFAADPANRRFTATLGQSDRIGEGAHILVDVQTGVVNPSTSGNYTLTVATSQEPAPSESIQYSIPATAATVPGVTGANVTLTDYEISKAAQYTLIFDLLSGLGDSDQIFITFPAHTVINNPVVTILAGSGWIGGQWSASNLSGPNITSDQGNYTITVTLGEGDAIGLGSQVRMNISSGIKNPPDPGDYTLTVHTNKNQLPVQSLMYTIVEPVPTPLPGIVSLYNPVGILIDNFTGYNAIQMALDQASTPGCFVKIGAGTYTENPVIKTPGTIIIKADSLLTEDVIVLGSWTAGVSDGVHPTVIQGLTLQPAIAGNTVLHIGGNLTTVEDCILKQTSGNLIISQADNVTITNCLFDTSNGDGSVTGILGSGGTMSVENCTFNGSGGYGIDFSAAQGTIHKCVFTNLNKGIIIGSRNISVINNQLYQNNIGLYLSSADNNTITNNIFSSNSWSAIDLRGNSDNNRMVNNTIVNNTPFGIICDVQSHLNNNNTVINSILWNNGYHLVYCQATYSDISDNDTVEGNNISLDPKFVDPAHGDYHLQADSPCIDSGNNNAVVSLVDIDNDVRIIDGDLNGSAVVDIGADEYSGNGYVTIGALDFHGVETGKNLDLVTPLVNNGASSFTVTGINLVSGSSEFTYVGPVVPFTVNAGETKQLTFNYAPQSEQSSDAVFLINTTNVLNPVLTVHGYGVVLLYSPGPGLPGDVNGDGHVNVLDITKIIRIILGLE